jgi:glycosyltransferase involved in cell wall biosynthesis
MKILYFSRDYTSHDYRFLTALAKSGHQVAYLRLERRGHQQEERTLPPEIEIVPWKGGAAPASLKDAAVLLPDLKRVIRRVKPDLIQAGPLQRPALLVALAGFKPLVSMSWGYDLLLDARRNFAWEWATRYTLKRSGALVGDCETIRRLAVSYGMPADRIVTFPWGIDLEHFSPASKMRPASPNLKGQRSPFTLLSTRAWEPIYGVEVIARAFVKAAARCPELRLVMLGNGSQAGLLRQILSHSGLTREEIHAVPTGRLSYGGLPDGGPPSGEPPSGGAHRVLFPGQAAYSDLPRYYRSADLYIAATHSDGTSISLLEAMACGTPVLVSDIPSNREWVEHGRNGWLFPDGDPNALAEAIREALAQRSRLPEMGRAAREIAEQRADWNENFPKLFQAYKICTE